MNARDNTPPPTPLRQSAVFYVSAANVLLLPFWVLAFSRNGMPMDAKFVEQYYELAQIFDYVDYFSALLLAVLIGIVLLIADRLIRGYALRFGSWLETVVAISALTMLIMAIWVLAFPPSGGMRLSNDWGIPIFIVGAIALAALVCLHFFVPGLVQIILRYGVIATAPVFFVFFANAVVAAQKTARPNDTLLTADHRLAPILPHSADKKRKRMIVIVFDMWDYGLTFERRPSWLKLPAVDDIARQSFFARKAYRAAPYTRMAFPSMLSGQRVVWAYPDVGDDLKIVFNHKYQLESWRANPGLFKSLRDQDLNIAVVATAYHPYCRLFHQFISYCWIDDTPFSFSRHTALNRIDDIVVEVGKQLPYLRQLFKQNAKPFDSNWGIYLYFAFKEKIKRLAVDPKYDFVFAHWYLPHPPFIHDLKTGEWKYFNEQADRKNYFGNLVALNKAIAEIKETMQKAGVWDDTSVLMTADHGYTLMDWKEYVPMQDRRVPFILKLPHQKEQVVSDKKFMMTSLRSVVEAIMVGKVDMVSQLENFLTYPQDPE